MKRANVSGFTLLELLVVVIIVGILATVAIPSFTRAMERSRQTEATSFLDTLKTAEEAYNQENRIYTGNFADLMVEQPLDTDEKRYFKYSLASSDSTHYTGTATRKLAADTGPGKGKSPAGSTAYTVTIEESGILSSSF